MGPLKCPNKSTILPIKKILLSSISWFCSSRPLSPNRLRADDNKIDGGGPSNRWWWQLMYGNGRLAAVGGWKQGRLPLLSSSSPSNSLVINPCNFPPRAFLGNSRTSKGLFGNPRLISPQPRESNRTEFLSWQNQRTPAKPPRPWS